MLQCIWGASFFAFLEETRVSLGAFVFLLWALLFFKMAIFRFPDYNHLFHQASTSDKHTSTKAPLAQSKSAYCTSCAVRRFTFQSD